ncbi:MAG: hypothetical protein ACMXYC_05035, partial [Candidatus Woesearchaeota archaeon]
MEASLKAQTATEYIIILSVVLVLAGIAVTIFYSPASSDGVQWLQQDIGIHNVVFSLHGVEFDVINTMQKTIMIHNISVGDVFLGSFDMVLLPQETRKIQSYDMLTQPGESVDISLSLSYVDQMQYVHTLEYASRTFSGAQKSRIVDRREKMGNQLIAYFPFDDSLEDMTPLRRHGVSSGSISYAHGMIGSAVNVSEGNISVDAKKTKKVGFTLAF